MIEEFNLLLGQDDFDGQAPHEHTFDGQDAKTGLFEAGLDVDWAAVDESRKTIVTPLV